MNYAIGIALMDSLWQGILVAAATWVILHVVPVRAPRSRYLAAVAGLLVCIGWFIITATSAYIEPTSSTVAGGRPTLLATWLARFTWLWIAGVAVAGMQRVLAWALLAYRVRTQTGAPLEAWTSALQAVQRRMKNAQRIVLRRADWLGSPSVYGWLKPVILIPARVVAGLTPQQLEAILAHELAHVLRHDYLVNLLQTAAETLLFYHPAVWWISKQIRQERECCCDRIAVDSIGDRAVFAGALLQLEEQRGASFAMSASQGSLKLRIERLFSVPRHPRHGWIALLLLAVCIAGPYVYAQADEVTPYTKWISEDVAYIVEKWELREFKALTSDKEREEFIERFWKRRDPTPETAENEAKEEHYRRIAYSGERFSGWRSDRARIYIQLGPPDEIESHPSQKREAWRYRNMPVGGTTDFRFLDGVLQKP